MNEMTTENNSFNGLKPCPWCGSAGALVVTNLGRGNGRGYPGCHKYEVRCSNIKCNAAAPYGAFDDIYTSSERAIAKAYTSWNKRTINE